MVRLASEQKPSRSRALEYALLIALAAVAVVRWAHLIEHIQSYYVDLPTWDYWRVVQNLAAYRAGNWKVFWLQHNEHRIVLPEMVFAADILWFHGRKILTTVMSLGCYFGTLLILAAALFQDPEMRRSVKLAAFLLASITLGWTGSAIVVGDPFLLQWTMLHFWIASSLILLSVARSRSSWLLLMTSVFCACGATYTSANGMLIWPILVSSGIVLRFSKSQILLIVLSGAAAVTTYFIGYRSMGHVSFTQFTSNFAHSLGFIGSYLGMPFAANRSRSFGIEAGWLNVLLFLFLFWTAARKRLTRARPMIVLFGLFCFTLLSAIIAAAGRMDPADRTFVLAKQARYVTAPLVNWAALVLFCVWLGSREGRTFWSSWRVPLVIALALLLGFRHLSSWVQARDAEVADLQLGVLGVQAGVLDDSVLKKIFPDPAFVRAYLPELRVGHLSIYSEDQTSWIGKSLPGLSSTVLPPRSGSIRWDVSLPSASELGIVTQGRTGEWLVFANRSYLVIGLGRRLPAGIPFTVQANMKGGQAMFGFVNAKIPAASWQAYQVREEDRALAMLQGVTR